MICLLSTCRCAWRWPQIRKRAEKQCHLHLCHTMVSRTWPLLWTARFLWEDPGVWMAPCHHQLPRRGKLRRFRKRKCSSERGVLSALASRRRPNSQSHLKAQMRRRPQHPQPPERHQRSPRQRRRKRRRSWKRRMLKGGSGLCVLPRLKNQLHHLQKKQRPQANRLLQHLQEMQRQTQQSRPKRWQHLKLSQHHRQRQQMRLPQMVAWLLKTKQLRKLLEIAQAARPLLTSYPARQVAIPD
mmetsp:Transcript_72418/g.125551  ORF Transcript_72418/g.125551 Transcript_72418/m.125551 type:complete len:241 (+) Transcript_72418:478-1200(+)